MTTYSRVLPAASTQIDSIKSLVCEACWHGIFSFDAWQTVLAAKQVSGRMGFSKGFAYRTTWAAIQTAAEHGGCNWCSLLSRRHSTRSTGASEVEVWAACDEDSDCTPAGEKKLRIVVHGHGILWEQQYYMYTNQDDIAAKFIKARNRITDVSSPERYRLALECIDNCVHTHHLKCPSPDPTTRLPDRVVDCSDVTRPKIVFTGGVQHGAYLTLSYVWGGPQPTTTTKNIDEYVTHGLDISKLPQTIQDAVSVTRGIGQRYLWVDALCIIQDSPEDRYRQLGQMRSIYRNAYLSINAACVTNSQKSFLHRHRPQKVSDARIPYWGPDGSVGSVWIAKDMDTDIPDASHSYWDELEPISYRGWCLQEKLLPPRSLVFASDTLKYFCQTETVNIGNALCEPSTGSRLPYIIYRPRPSSNAPLSEADQVAYRQAWLAVLFMYTLRKITDPSDKLVALAGVAEQFHLVYKNEYLAGLWRKTLLLDLLWKSTPHGELHPRPISYRAPSWSWASIDGLVEADYSFDQKLASNLHLQKAEIVSCNVELASAAAPFAGVTGGNLRLKGLMKQATLKGQRLLLTNQSQKPVDIGYVSFDADEQRPKTAYVVLLMWDILSSFSAGVVVVPASEDQSRYRRIGRFMSDIGSNGWLESLNEQEIVLV